MNRLEVTDIHKTYGSGKNTVKASDGVSFSIRPGQTLALIGESGSGKSTIGRICLGAESSDRGRLTMDGVVFSGMDRASLAMWRRRSSIVLQEPELALNPRRTVGQSVCEPLQVLLDGVSVKEIRERAEHALEMAHLSPGLWERYPSELSGGQQQRVGIARAVVTEPDFIVLDEPTASLDLSVRSKIIDTLSELQARMNVSYLLITHDMATVAALAHTVAVLYKGKVVEQGDRRAVLDSPQNLYTQKLMSAVLKVKTRE
jgi:ABC-type glutathione transport system ATPase component